MELENDIPLPDDELNTEPVAELAADEDIEVVIDDSTEEEAAPVEDEGETLEAEATETGDTEAPAEGEEEDAELAGMPDKIKKRFQREKRLRDTIIGEREQIRGIALQAAQVLQRRDAELAEERRRLATIQKQYADTMEFSYEQAIVIAQNELRKAKDEGNYDAELQIQGKLDQLRFQQNQIRETKRHIPNPESIPVPQATPAPQQMPQQAPRPAPPLAVKWINTNRSWFDSPKFASHRAFVLTEDKRLAAEGYDQQSPEYYRELDRRIDAAFPTLRKRTVKNGSPVAPASSRPANNTSKQVVRLSKSDLATMARFGLDPRNKEHLREFARSKRAG